MKSAPVPTQYNRFVAMQTQQNSFQHLSNLKICNPACRAASCYGNQKQSFANYLSMITSIVRFLNTMLAALLAGTSFGIWMGFNPVNYSATTYLAQQQNTIGSLNVLMISLVVSATIITLIAAFLQKQNKPVFIALIFAAICFIACILISRFGNQPINDSIMKWNSNSIPANWAFLRDKWWSFHIMRTITELVALSLITWTNVRK